MTRSRSWQRKPKPDERKLAQLIAEYRDKAVETQRYNFDINAARLSEHARLQHLLMRIVGRLTDYTLLWERDRIYAFLGMLYKQLGGLQIVLSTSLGLDDKRPHIGIRSQPEPAESSCWKVYQRRSSARRQTKKLKPDKLLLRQFTKEGFLPLWGRRDGFALSFFKLYKHLLAGDNRPLFDRYFEGVTREHPGDWDARQLARKNNMMTRGENFRLGRQQIRNDFAHYNVIGQAWSFRFNKEKSKKDWHNGERKRLEMSYLVNSVRSLMAYDRKLKNAVSQSIANIIEEEGLFIRWAMKDDRLKAATVAPRLQPHLTMLRGKMADDHRLLPAAGV
jgi:hypothetical protein